jgi:hypothetical protein
MSSRLRNGFDRSGQRCLASDMKGCCWGQLSVGWLCRMTMYRGWTGRDYSLAKWGLYRGEDVNLARRRLAVTRVAIRYANLLAGGQPSRVAGDPSTGQPGTLPGRGGDSTGKRTRPDSWKTAESPELSRGLYRDSLILKN